MFIEKIATWLWIMSLVCAQTLWGQDTLKPKVILKTTPSMLLDWDNTLALGVEIPLYRHWSLQQDLGWGNSKFNLWGDGEQYPNKNNWRFRTQLRYYFTDNSVRMGGWYFAAEYFRKEIFIVQNHAFGRDCNPTTGVCAYFEEGLLHTRRRVSALHGKMGYQWFIPDTRLVFDCYFGGGYRRLIVTNDDPSFRGNWVRNPSLFRPIRPQKYEPAVSLSFGFSLGILFAQKREKAVPLHL